MLEEVPVYADEGWKYEDKTSALSRVRGLKPDGGGTLFERLAGIVKTLCPWAIVRAGRR